MRPVSKSTERQRALSAAVSYSASKPKAKSVIWRQVYHRKSGKIVPASICCGVRYMQPPHVVVKTLQVVDTNTLTTIGGGLRLVWSKV